MRGEVITPEGAAYEQARRVYNAMIDRHPRLIPRCADVADVRTAVRFARAHDLLLAVREGSDGVRYIFRTILLHHVCPIDSVLDANTPTVSIGWVAALKAKPQATNGRKDYGPASRQNHAEGIQVHQGVGGLPARNPNILIGANGAGKSNSVSFFTFLREAAEGRLGFHVVKRGGAADHLFMGPEVTEQHRG